jgi:hypothetical protein
MIKNFRLLRQFEKEKIDFKTALKIFESFWKEALKFKAITSKNPLEGIEADIRMAKIINSCSKNF